MPLHNAAASSGASTVTSQIWGWDGAAWAEAILAAGDSDDVADTSDGLQVNARLYGYDGTAYDRIRAITPGAYIETADAVGCLQTVALLYGWDGNTFRQLRLTSAQRPSLKVQPVDDVWHGINFEKNISDNLNSGQWYGVVTHSTVVGYNGATLDRIRSNSVPDSIAAGIGNLQVTAALYGWDGSNLRRLQAQAISGSESVLLVGTKGISNVELRAASGTLSAGETSTPVTGLDHYNQAVIRLDVTEITTPDVDDEVDFYLQTSYNGGADWVDLENIHFDNGDNGTTAKKLLVIGGPQSSAVARAETDGSLADNTKLDLPIGDRLRWKTAVTGATAPSYAYNSEASLKGS